MEDESSLLTEKSVKSNQKLMKDKSKDNIFSGEKSQSENNSQSKTSINFCLRKGARNHKTGDLT